MSTKKEPTWDSLLSLAKMLDNKDSLVKKIAQLEERHEALKRAIKATEEYYDKISKDVRKIEEIIEANCPGNEH